MDSESVEPNFSDADEDQQKSTESNKELVREKREGETLLESEAAEIVLGFVKSLDRSTSRETGEGMGAFTRGESMTEPEIGTGL
ncbi:hypothetical protein K7X08_003273 [Anisodus acutangulus]|uniref:Uncharacterized protein n=1 Tax=Anisodus acutangulus TaxID=402998 RepID=A0A9Q1MDR2_9SOLA|nr:hypothetical protein K7X08_003273 [Anisodus acutangulus]